MLDLDNIFDLSDIFASSIVWPLSLMNDTLCRKLVFNAGADEPEAQDSVTEDVQRHKVCSQSSYHTGERNKTVN